MTASSKPHRPTLPPRLLPPLLPQARAHGGNASVGLGEEVAGDNPTPLEVLLTENVVSCWLWLTVLDALNSARFSKYAPSERRVSVSYLQHMVMLQASSHRSFLSSVQVLARVRKLQANTPGVQFNQQINVLRD